MATGSAAVLIGRRAAAHCAGSVVGGPRLARYWHDVLEGSPQRIASNFDVAAGIVQHGADSWPLTVSSRAIGNAYPCSLHTQYVEYPRVEARLLRSGLERVVSRGALSMLDTLLRTAGIDRHAQWSSWLLSTHLHPVGICEAVAPVTNQLVEAYPDHVIVLRCVDPRTHRQLPDALREQGYVLVASRQVWYFDGAHPEFLRRSDVKRDGKLLDQLRDYSCSSTDSPTAGEVSRMTSLYRAVYLERHSHFNPAYSDDFLRRGLADDWLNARVLRHRSGRIDGVFARFDGEVAASVPFIGYDTTLPGDLGLYRALVALLLRDITAEGVLLNYSSGAGDFKRRRGGEMSIEYNAVFARHLPPARRAALEAGCRAINAAATRLFGTRVL